MKCTPRANAGIALLVAGFAFAALAAIGFHFGEKAHSSRAAAVKELPEIHPNLSMAPRPLPDSALKDLVHCVSREFLAEYNFTSLSATVLIPDNRGGWKKGSYRGGDLWYPGCTAKLASLPVIANLLSEQVVTMNHSVSRSLEEAYGPSYNPPYGEVVDVFTTTENIPIATPSDPHFQIWKANRLVFHRYWEKIGELGDQVFVNKTYPSNSGQSPRGAEHLLASMLGPNRMTTDFSAWLMLGIVEGTIEPESQVLMLKLLRRDRWAFSSGLGHGLPPGSIYYSKSGCGRSTIGDVAYIELPNGQKLVISIYCNGRVPPYADDKDNGELAILGMFAERIIEEAQLNPDQADIILRAGHDFRPADHGTIMQETPWFDAVLAAGVAEGKWLETSVSGLKPGRYELQYFRPTLPSPAERMEFHVESIFSKTSEKKWSRTHKVDLSTSGDRYFLIDKVLIETAGEVLYVAIVNPSQEAKAIAVSHIRLRKIKGDSFYEVQI